jgi:hypothetical protein
VKRTPFKKKPYTWNRNKPKKPRKGLFDHLKKESKNHEWNRIKREILDPYFHANDLYYICELKLPNICSGNAMKLTYAHSKKRGYIAKKEPERTRELCEVVRACINCHHTIEYPKGVSKAEGLELMFKAVTECIERRNRRLRLYEKVV